MAQAELVQDRERAEATEKAHHAFERVLAPVLNVDERVVERRAVIAREGIAVTERVGGSEYVWGDDFLEQTLELGVRQTDAVSAWKFSRKVRVPLTSNPYRTNYAVTADGQRFLVNTRIGEAVSAINLISNWPVLLKK